MIEIYYTLNTNEIKLSDVIVIYTVKTKVKQNKINHLFLIIAL